MRKVFWTAVKRVYLKVHSMVVLLDSKTVAKMVAKRVAKMADEKVV